MEAHWEEEIEIEIGWHGNTMMGPCMTASHACMHHLCIHCHGVKVKRLLTVMDSCMVSCSVTCVPTSIHVRVTRCSLTLILSYLGSMLASLHLLPNPTRDPCPLAIIYFSLSGSLYIGSSLVLVACRIIVFCFEVNCILLLCEHF